MRGEEGRDEGGQRAMGMKKTPMPGIEPGSPPVAGILYHYTTSDTIKKETKTLFIVVFFPSQQSGMRLQ